MAHVLLPSDLPSWPEVVKLLEQLQPCPDPGHMLTTMQRIALACSVSLDPEEGEAYAPVGLLGLNRFVEDVLTREERSWLLEVTLPTLAARAADLPSLRPPHGLRYSLQKENGTFHLSRGLVSSLLANAFFSTFPKRTTKTHPTLQDFRMGDFFAHLNKRRHQRKLKAFFQYFDNLTSEDPTGEIVFTRKVVSGPSLPGWLCSDRALVPLVLRPEDEEPNGYRTCFCSPLIGGDVMKASNSKEAKLMFEFPELLVILSFVESLGEDETLVAEMCGSQEEVGFCFLDSSVDALEDLSLLRELNKGLTAFLQQEPLNLSGWSSSQGSNAADDTRYSISLPEDTEVSSLGRSSSKISLRTAASQSVEEDFYTADDDSDGASSRLSDSAPDPSVSRSDSLPDASVSRSDSVGFVLGGGTDDGGCSAHERLEDFRRRIRKRTRRRRLARRGSYGSGGSSGSSDMEDISEDPELDSGGTVGGMRPANSEPSIANAAPCQAPVCDAVALQGRRLMVRASNGRLKAYSYDGVSPNLPVPFRARFRKKPSRESTRDSSPPSSTGRPVCVECGECSQLTVALLWLAASMARLPALELFTDGQQHMQHVHAVYKEVLRREWTVGDLSCEVLRFCRMRNKQQLLEQEQQPQLLFQQLLGTSYCSSSRDDSMDSLD